MTLLSILCTMGLPAIDDSLAGLLEAMAGAHPPGFGPAISMSKSLGLLFALCVGAYESWMMMLGRRGMDVMKLLRIIGISFFIIH